MYFLDYSSFIMGCARVYWQWLFCKPLVRTLQFIKVSATSQCLGVLCIALQESQRSTNKPLPPTARSCLRSALPWPSIPWIPIVSAGFASIVHATLSPSHTQRLALLVDFPSTDMFPTMSFIAASLIKPLLSPSKCCNTHLLDEPGTANIAIVINWSFIWWLRKY